jgi:hypothetical protein
MRMRGLAVVVCAALVCVAIAFAEEKFGVQVYPKATLDAAATEAARKVNRKDAACYRTTDALETVIAFYKQQGNLTLMGTLPEGAAFFKGKNEIEVLVTIENPWKDPATGAKVTDTLITFMNQKQ